jgi:hypothetical protein
MRASYVAAFSGSPRPTARAVESRLVDELRAGPRLRSCPFVPFVDDHIVGHEFSAARRSVRMAPQSSSSAHREYCGPFKAAVVGSAVIQDALTATEALNELVICCSPPRPSTRSSGSSPPTTSASAPRTRHGITTARPGACPPGPEPSRTYRYGYRVRRIVGSQRDAAAAVGA